MAEVRNQHVNREMGAPNGPLSLRAVVADVTSVVGYRARTLRLSTHRPSFGGDLVSEFRARAQTEIGRDPREAEDIARLGARLATTIRDAPGRHACLSTRVEAALVGGRSLAALRYVDMLETAPFARSNELQAARLDALRVDALFDLKRHDEACEIGAAALAVFEGACDVPGAIAMRMRLAALAHRLERPREALRHYASVDRRLQDDAPPVARGALAAGRANALVACGRFRAAERHFARARALFDDAGCEREVANVDRDHARADALRGRYEQADQGYSRAHATLLRLTDERSLGHIALDRAEIHLHLDLAAGAFDLAGQAEAHFAGAGLERESARAADLGAGAATLCGRLREAWTLHVRAESIYERLGLSELRARALVRRAGLAESERRVETARTLLDEAELLLPAGTRPLATVGARLLRACIDLSEGNTATAIERVRAVLRDCQHIHAPWISVESQRIMGGAFARNGEVAKAVRAYESAVDHLACHGGGVPPDEFMAAFVASRAAVYAEFGELLLSAGRDQRAFQITEQAQCASGLDVGARLPAVVTANGAVSGAGHATSARLRHLHERLNAAYWRVARWSRDADSRSARAACAARRQASELETEMTRIRAEQNPVLRCASGR